MNLCAMSITPPPPLPQKGELRGEWKSQWPMSRLSAWRVGGYAEHLYSPADLDDFRVFLQMHEASAIVGLGSNLLARDGGVDGIVVRTAPGLAQLKMEERGGGGRIVYAEAGVASPKLARFCAQHNLEKAEFFCGIPGSIGGALAMNAGCFGGQTWDYVKRVLLLGDGGELLMHSADDFIVGYRKAALKKSKKKAMRFAAAWFCFPLGDGSRARKKIAELLHRRQETQPIGEPNAGSVFKNPPNDFAGRLIEECGLKGKRIGGAEISRKHANFIVAKKGATADDVESLILLAQKAAREKCGINLEMEVRIIGKKAGEKS